LPLTIIASDEWTFTMKNTCILIIYSNLDVSIQLLLWMQHNYNVHQWKVDTWQPKGHALFEMCHISMIRNSVHLTKENESQVLKWNSAIVLRLTICNYIWLQIMWSQHCHMYILADSLNIKLRLGFQITINHHMPFGT
jgi:hypothetical protein